MLFILREKKKEKKKKRKKNMWILGLSPFSLQATKQRLNNI